MNRQINELLESIREELVEGRQEIGNGEKPPKGAMPKGGGTEPNKGEGNRQEIDAPDNPSDADDAMSMFIAGLVAALLERYDIGEDDAIMFITGMAEVFKDSGLLPPIPADSDPEVIKAEWLGAAQANGFAAEVMQAADEIAED
jgi:hypothetical protein